MKNIYYKLLTIIILLSSCAEKKEVEKIPLIEGLIANYYGTPVLFFNNENPTIPLDTVSVSAAGAFTVPQKSIKAAGFYYLEFNGNEKIDLFLKPNDYINLELDADSISETYRSNNSKFMTALWALQKNNKMFVADIKKLTLEFDEMVGKTYKDSLYQSMYFKKDSIQNFYKSRSLEITEDINSPIIDFFMLNQKTANISQFSLEDDKQLFLDNAKELSTNPQFEALFKAYISDVMEAYTVMDAE